MEEDNNQIAFSVPQMNPNELLTLAGSRMGVPLPTRERTEELVDRAQFGYGNTLNMSAQDIRAQISQGQEQQLRERIAFQEDQKKQGEVLKNIQALSAGKGSALTKEEFDSVIDPWNNKTPPSTVLEEAYARRYINSLQSGAYYMQMESELKELQEKRSNLEVLAKVYSDSFVKHQLLFDKLKQAQEASKAQSYAGDVIDRTKELTTQVYSTYKDRNRLYPDQSFFQNGIGDAAALAAERRRLFTETNADFKSKLDAAVDPYISDNPHGAAAYVQSLIGMTPGEVLGKNFMTYLGALDIAGAATLGYKGVGLTRRAISATQVGKAYEDMAKGFLLSKNKNPFPGQVNSQPTLTREAAMAESVGDVANAALNQNFHNQSTIANGMADIPSLSQENLLTFAKAQATQMVQGDLGKQSRALRERIADTMLAVAQGFPERFKGLLKVDRTGGVLDIPENRALILEDQASRYKGAGTLLDAEFVNFNPEVGPNKAILYNDPLTNTPWIKESIGNIDGTLFPDPATAEGFKSTKQGLPEGILRPKEGPITSRATQAKIIRRDFVNEQLKRVQDEINKAKAVLSQPETHVVSEGKKRFYSNGDGNLYPSIDQARQGLKEGESLKYIDLSETQLRKNFPTAVSENAKAGKFKTAKGSSYVVHEDGTTTRTKAARPEHSGDSGLKPKSLRTVYVDKATSDSILKVSNKFALILNDDNTITLVKNINNSNQFWKRPDLKFSNTPAVGLSPVEFGHRQNTRVGNAFSRTHVGNKITSISLDTADLNSFKAFSHDKGLSESFKTMKGPEGTTHTAARASIERFNKQAENLTSESARISAELLSNKNGIYNIHQHGLGYYIEHIRPLDTEDDVVRHLMTRNTDDSLRETANVSVKGGFKNIAKGFLGHWMTPNNILSKEDNLQRITAESAVHSMHDYLKDGFRFIEDVVNGRLRVDPSTGERINPLYWIPRSAIAKLTERKAIKQFNEVLDYSKTAFNPLKPDEQGYFFKTLAELDEHYIKTYGRSASESEHFAYSMYRTLHELDAISLEIGVAQNKAHKGFQQFQVYFKGPDKARINSEFFDAKRLDKLPAGRGRILVLGPDKGSEELFTLGDPRWLKRRDSLKANVESGKGTVLEFWAKEEMPLAKFSDLANGRENIHYLYTENGLNTKPITFNAVSRKEGGHWDYKYSNWLKQAVMDHEGTIAEPGDLSKDRWTYLRDQTLMPVSNRLHGENLAKIFNEGRIALAKGDDLGARFAIGKTGVPFKDFKSWFSDRKMPDGTVKPASFSLNEDFRVVRSDQSIMDLDKNLEQKYKRMGRKEGETDNDFYDSYNKSSPSQEFRSAWLNQRDPTVAWTVEDVSRFGAPVYNYRPAVMEQPLTTLNKSLNRATSSLWMNDYKHFAVNSWIEQASDHLEASLNELRSAPYYYYYNPVYKDSARVSEVANNLENIKNAQRIFMGTPSAFDTHAHRVAQWASDLLYEKVGKSATLVPEWLFNNMNKPIDRIRSFAFDMKLGLFSPVNFMVQSQTYVNIMALEPRHGTAGTAAQQLYLLTRYDSSPEMLAKLDNLATKMNVFGSRFKPGEFTEGLKALQSSGWEFIGSSHAADAGKMEASLIKNDLKGFLDLGRGFFRMSEKMPRIAAYFTSYRKWRELNPTAALTPKAEREILGYADDLTFNMTRAASSALHTGMFSLTNQFMAYQFRMIELMLSKRLGGTTAERVKKRAQLLGAYWANYGVAGAGGVLIYPMGEIFRNKAIENGYVPGEDKALTLLMEGINASMLAWVTGKGNMADGKVLDWGGRYGPQGATQVRELLRTDANFLKVVGGAGLSIMTQTMSDLDSISRDLISFINNDPKRQHEFLWTDVTKPLRNATVVNQFVKTVDAINSGYWSNKKEGYTEKTSVPMAIFQGLAGAEPLSQTSMFNMMGIVKGWQENQKEAFKDATMEWQRAARAWDKGDTQSYEIFRNRAFTILNNANLNDSQKAAWVQQASKGYETLLDTATRNFYRNRSVPEDKIDSYDTTYGRILRQRDRQ